MAMQLAKLVSTWEELSATRSRKRKTVLLAELLAAADTGELPSLVAFLSGHPRQDRLGVGWAALRDIDVDPAFDSSLTVLEVERSFASIADEQGPGSSQRRRTTLTRLFSEATALEQDFLSRLMMRNLRQGALQGIAIAAIAEAMEAEEGLVRRALMLTGDLVETALLSRSGNEALAGVRLQVMRPVQPMLAQTAGSVGEAIAAFGRASVEAKLDGARVQIHVAGPDVGVFTRNLREVTGQLPDVVSIVTGWDLGSAVLDGEVIALRDDGRPHPFQVTMARFATKADGEALAGQQPLTVTLFDVLHADGVDQWDTPLEDRWAALERLTPNHVVERLITEDAAEAESFWEGVLAAGHEGVMVKGADSLYEAGRRGSAWLKVKPEHTLDLVVLAVEWGSGRRQGTLSNIHLGARDSEGGGFVMLGKTFKGMTDATLAWQTIRFLELETHREGHVVHVRPEQVVEIAFDGVQASRRYPGGVALRFARVKQYRHDKRPNEADTIDTVRGFLEG